MIINGKAAAAALVKARAAIGATVGKDAKGNFGHYATLAAVMEAIAPALAANALALVQEIEVNGSEITSSAMLVHETGETIEFVPLTMPLDKRTAQEAGKAATYARRYQLMALFGLAPDDDLDAAPQMPQNAPGRTQPRVVLNHTTPPAKTQQQPATQPTVTIDAAPEIDANGPDNLFEDNTTGAAAKPLAGQKTLARLHILGQQFYGSKEAWDAKRPELVEYISQGAVKSSKELTEAEARRLCANLEAKIAKQQQPDAKLHEVA